MNNCLIPYPLKCRILQLIVSSSVLVSAISCNNNQHQIGRRDAEDVIYSVDSLNEQLGPPEKKLVAYFRIVNSAAISSGNIQLPREQADSLNVLYNDLKTAYDRAINEVSQNHKFANFDSLKSKYLTLLNKGRESWVKLYPLHIKAFRYGLDSLNQQEREQLINADSTFSKAGVVALEWCKIVADEQVALEKKYKLKSE